jgi:crotonobetainyl-CoA:carnitine CoA-transferase CaiB-like acyl-CoA transferase
MSVVATSSGVDVWLRSLGLSWSQTDTAVCDHLAWAASGAMTLTGFPGSAPLPAPGSVGGLAADVLAAISVLTCGRADFDLAQILSGRAGVQGLAREGRTSIGGASRILRGLDGFVAVTLARSDDVESVPAMFGDPKEADPWQSLERAAGACAAHEFVERVRLFGVPAGVVLGRAPENDLPWRVEARGEAGMARSAEGALVVDLSSLWAGPLCGQVLTRAGARVVKVESTRRPDGARHGTPRLYDWLHAGQESVAVDFGSAEGRSQLARLLGAADVVIEASRPRALEQIGVGPRQTAAKPGAVWVSITGHGRSAPELVGFGDDAAATGGLAAQTPQGPVFCGDAIADPLTGITAGLGALAALAAGGGVLLDLALAGVAAAYAGASPRCRGEHRVDATEGSWTATCAAVGRSVGVATPAELPPTPPAPSFGHDTARVLAELG